MAGSRKTGVKTRDILLAKYGADYYSRIGKKSWENVNRKPHGYATMDKDLVRKYASQGGKKSRGGGTNGGRPRKTPEIEPFDAESWRDYANRQNERILKKPWNRK